MKKKEDYDGGKNLLHRMIGSSAHAKKEQMRIFMQQTLRQV